MKVNNKFYVGQKVYIISANFNEDLLIKNGIIEGLRIKSHITSELEYNIKISNCKRGLFDEKGLYNTKQEAVSELRKRAKRYHETKLKELNELDLNLRKLQ